MHRAEHEDTIDKVLDALEVVYGPVRELTPSQALSWVPPPASAGHLGRYLWTDAFGVVDFITLFRMTSSITYLHLAARLIDAVHNTLGRTRSQEAYLPGASQEHPLAGGLRIGKDEESGPDGDGQYHHYLTLWMFALNRMSIITGEQRYNDLAIELAKAIHPAFMVERSSPRPRMFWKMSMDLSQPLVRSEGNLDPIGGYVVYNLLQERSPHHEILKQEISEYKRILDIKWKKYQSDDPLDLGMTLWTAHWFAGKEQWADHLVQKAATDLHELAVMDRYFEHPVQQRLAFREFGTCMGVVCASDWPILRDKKLPALHSLILRQWENAGVGCSTRVTQMSVGAMRAIQRQGLRPITMVMYAAALLPGAFRRGFLGED